MCTVKGCRRPRFLAGLCGFHALQGWEPGLPLRARRPRRARGVGRPAAPHRDATR